MLREEYEKETGNKCPEDVFNSLDYYHYEKRYSRWLESKLTAQNTTHNSEYKQCESDKEKLLFMKTSG